MMVYNDDAPEHEISMFLEEKEFDNNPLEGIKTILKNTPLPFDTNIFTKVPEEHKKLFSKMFPLNKEKLTFYDFMQHQLSFSREMTTNSKLYSELRNYIFENFNKGKYDVRNEEVDFNQAFKDSYFQKTFIEYVKQSLNPNDQTKILYYDFYIQSYNILDILGISKDKIKARNGFNNILNDAMHSYYAMHCDYLVTEDKGLTEKSKALYNLFNIHTKVVSTDEFLKILPDIGTDTEINITHFVNKFIKDTIEGEKSELTNLPEDTISFRIEIHEKYFNFFDQMVQFIMMSGEMYFVLEKKEEYFLSSPNFREQEALVNKCINFWGLDVNQYGLFDFDNEIELIKNNKWVGRLWKFNNILFYLHKNNGTDKICLQIGPFNPTATNGKE